MIIETTAEEQKILKEALDHQVDSYASPYVTEHDLKPIRTERKLIIREFELFQEFTAVQREFIKNGIVKMRKYEDIDISDQSDLELFLDLDKFHTLAKRNDEFSHLFNKFKTQKDRSKELYLPLIEKLIELRSNHRIYLSESDDDGSIYKFCLIGVKQYGFGYKSKRLTLELDYEKQSLSNYEREGDLSELVKLINDKVDKATVTKFEEQILQILNCCT